MDKSNSQPRETRFAGHLREIQTQRATLEVQLAEMEAELANVRVAQNACPIQLDEPTWHSIGDVDPKLAKRIRERLFRELEDGVTFGAGAHFPELQFGRVLTGNGRRWLT